MAGAKSDAVGGEVGVDDRQLVAMAHGGHHLEQLRGQQRVDVFQHCQFLSLVVPGTARSLGRAPQPRLVARRRLGAELPLTCSVGERVTILAAPE